METDNRLNTCDNAQVEEIVNALYRGLLGRNADKVGLAYWSNLLVTGVGMATLFDAIRTSDEYQSRQKIVEETRTIRQKVAAWSQLNLEHPLLIVDVGAQKLDDEEDIYSGIVTDAVPHKIIGFEPLQHRMEEASIHQSAQNTTFLPFFIGDGGSYTFHINRPDATSSLLPFNTPLISGLVGLSDLHTEKTEKVETKTLDEALKDEKTIDFLKLDIQGFELKALQSAPQVMQRTNVIHCEVSFAEIYQGQAFFSELELFMRQAGFMFVDFSHLCRYAYHGDYTNHRDRLGWGDAIFLRDTQNVSPKDLLAQSLIALFVYDKLSLAQSLAQRYDLCTGASFASLLKPESEML